MFGFLFSTSHIQTANSDYSRITLLLPNLGVFNPVPLFHTTTRWRLPFQLSSSSEWHGFALCPKLSSCSQRRFSRRRLPWCQNCRSLSMVLKWISIVSAVQFAKMIELGLETNLVEMSFIYALTFLFFNLFKARRSWCGRSERVRSETGSADGFGSSKMRNEREA